MQISKNIGKVQVFKEADATYEGALAKLVVPPATSTMSLAFGKYHNTGNAEWTIRYDEVIYVLEGVLRLTIEGEVHEFRAGELLWVPENTTLIYDGENAKVLFVIAPANWREIHGIS